MITVTAEIEEDLTTTASRESRLNATFLRLSDTVLGEFDMAVRLHELLVQCVEIFAVEDAGLMLADERGRLQIFSSTGIRTNLVEIVQLTEDAGPCVQVFETGKAVSVATIQATDAVWPQFAEVALQQGFRAAHVVPMRVRKNVIGVLGLWSAQAGALHERDAEAVRALAEVATIGILTERLMRERAGTVNQLQHALDTRVLVEQAKGVLSQAWAVEMTEAYEIMRKYARSQRIPVQVLAASVVDRSLDLAVVLSAADG